MNTRTLARLIGGGRLAIGVLALVDPERLARPWIGPLAKTGPVQVLARALGIRDFLLGLATLISVGRGGDGREWLAAGVIGDGTDFVATMAAGPDVPLAGKAMIAGVAGGVTAVQVAALVLLDD